MTGAGDDPRATEGPPLERLRSGGTSQILAVVVVIGMALAVLVWRPWAPTQASPPSPLASPSPAVAEASATRAAPHVPSPSATAASASVDSEPIGPYRSLVDNEWTVVALLTLTAASTDEPAMPHVSAEPWSADGPFLVVQQGLGLASGQPRPETGGTTGVCSSAAPPLARPAVHLPAGRVAYLGVTYPGMDPQALISATVLGRSGVTLQRVSPVVVQLDGLSPVGRYIVPGSGPGGTVLFATTAPGIIPIDAYRFAVTLPGVAGTHYLYACIGT